MNRNSKEEIVSCFQCSGLYYCYGSKQPDLDRDQARSVAADCVSLRKGSPNETVAVRGFKCGLSRKNAENLVLMNLARWSVYKTIEPVDELPYRIYKRLTRERNKKRNS